MKRLGFRIAVLLFLFALAGLLALRVSLQIWFLFQKDRYVLFLPDQSQEAGLLVWYRFSKSEVRYQVIADPENLNFIPDTVTTVAASKLQSESRTKAIVQYIAPWPGLGPITESLIRLFYADDQLTHSRQLHPQCSVAVLNGVSVSGLAAKTTDLLEENGFVVTRVDDYPQESDRTQIIVDPEWQELCQPELTLLNRAFSVPPEQQKQDSLVKEYRSAVLVILGKDKL